MAGEKKLVAAIIRRLTTHEVNLTMAGSPNVKRVGVWHFVVITFGAVNPNQWATSRPAKVHLNNGR